jgi:HPt (histidine-containing phosphotransfer) domain-containing protein
MAEHAIDAATFADLQDAAGADFVRELVDTFLQEAPPMLAALRTALAAGQAETFRRTAHSLKSNASTFGALVLAGSARALEQQGVAATRPEALDALDAEYARAVAELRALRDG